MQINNLSYFKVKKKYLKFIKSQEALSEPFRDKISQLREFCSKQFGFKKVKGRG